MSVNLGGNKTKIQRDLSEHTFSAAIIPSTLYKLGTWGTVRRSTGEEATELLPPYPRHLWIEESQSGTDSGILSSFVSTDIASR